MYRLLLPLVAEKAIVTRKTRDKTNNREKIATCISSPSQEPIVDPFESRPTRLPTSRSFILHNDLEVGINLGKGNILERPRDIRGGKHSPKHSVMVGSQLDS